MSKIQLSEEDQKIATELQSIMGGEEMFEEKIVPVIDTETIDIKYSNTTNVAISESNDIRRLIADMIK